MKKTLNLVTLIGFIFSVTLLPFSEAASAQAQGLNPVAGDDNPIFMYKIEDPRLKRIVGQLKALIPVMIRMIYTFKWLTSPRTFYRTLKRVFVAWHDLMTELFAVLIEYARELTTEINKDKCKTRSCH